MKQQDIYQQNDYSYYLQVHNRYPITLVKGKGSHIWDSNGKKYIDVLAGIAVNSVGHCHPRVRKAICRQAKELGHISNFYLSKPQAQLAKSLSEHSGLDRTFLCNSGAEANEAAFKMARKYAHSKGRGGTIIALENCFHGRTLATIATGKAKHQEGFEPLPGGFKKVPANDISAIRELITDEVAGIIIEPVQGEGGIRIMDEEYLQQVRELCDIFDEIQCGMGRTGTLFAFEHYNITPDIMTLAKALGGGLPIGAMLSKQSVANAMSYGDHSTTFGGNPISCAAALEVLQILDKESLPQRAHILGTTAMQRLQEYARQEEAIIEVRGLGLMIGVELNIKGRPVINRMLEKGVLANVTGDKIIRFLPPLNISEKDFNKAIDIFIESLQEVKSEI